MTLTDWLRLIHPILAVAFVFPMIGIVSNYAWQTRQRRLAILASKTKPAAPASEQSSEAPAKKAKSKIPATVGAEHVKLGRWLTGAVVGVSLVGMVHPIFKTLIEGKAWETKPLTLIFVILMFGAAIASLFCLYRARSKAWRATFATLSSAAIIILGGQDGVYRRSSEWAISHYYYGITAAILMVISLAVLPEIYRSKSWRNSHIALNCLALLIFIGLGITGTRDLLEIPLSWQAYHLGSGCDWSAKVCGQ